MKFLERTSNSENLSKSSCCRCSNLVRHNRPLFLDRIFALRCAAERNCLCLSNFPQGLSSYPSPPPFYYLVSPFGGGGDACKITIGACPSVQPDGNSTPPPPRASNGRVTCSGCPDSERSGVERMAAHRFFFVVPSGRKH